MSARSRRKRPPARRRPADGTSATPPGVNRPPAVARPSASKRAAPTRRRRGPLIPLVTALGVALLLGLVGIYLRGDLTRGLSQLQGPPSVSGLALLPDASGVVAYDLATKSTIDPIQAPPDGWVGAVDATPDGSRIVAQLYEPSSSGSGQGVSSLVVRGPDGAVRPLARPEQDEFLSEPRWSPDGAAVYLTRRLVRKPNPGEPKQRVERLDVATGARTVILDDASAPSPSPDGASLAVLRDQDNWPVLSVIPAAGGAPRDLIPARRFSGMLSPRFSPDGASIAVGLINQSSASVDGGLLADLLAPQALAHGVPWDVWLVSLDATPQVRRLSSFNQDSPFPAWSPDGRYILARAEYNTFLIDSRGGQFWQLNDQGGYGNIAWTTAAR
jgi:Tol biopolymer transport system component